MLSIQGVEEVTQDFCFRGNIFAESKQSVCYLTQTSDFHKCIRCGNRLTVNFHEHLITHLSICFHLTRTKLNWNINHLKWWEVLRDLFLRNREHIRSNLCFDRVHSSPTRYHGDARNRHDGVGIPKCPPVPVQAPWLHALDLRPAVAPAIHDGSPAQENAARDHCGCKTNGFRYLRCR